MKKIKISSIDISSFPQETLVVDDYWRDLYDPEYQRDKIALL